MLSVAATTLGLAGVHLRIARMSLGVIGTMLGATGRSLARLKDRACQAKSHTGKCSVAAGSPRDESVRLGGRVACIALFALPQRTPLPLQEKVRSTTLRCERLPCKTVRLLAFDGENRPWVQPS